MANPCPVPSDRVARAQALMARLNLAGLLFFDLKNIRYLTGFSGSDGVLWMDGAGLTLLVDGRYTTQAGEEAAGVAVREYRDKTDGMADVIARVGAGAVGIEASALVYEAFLRLEKKCPQVRFRAVDEDLRLLRAIKNATEVALIEQACAIAGQALAETLPLCRLGAAERDLALELDYRMRRLGAEGAAFPTIVASGPFTAMPHAHPGSRCLTRGDALLFDFGAVVGGYCSDESRTFFVEEVSDAARDAYGIVAEAQNRALTAIRPGVACRDVDAAARFWIESQGHGSRFPHGTGHGLGLAVHEAPRLSAVSDAVLAEGMVITVEPGVYLPGRWGIRIEDTVVVEKDGCRLLTKTPKTLQILDGSLPEAGKIGTGLSRGQRTPCAGVGDLPDR